MKRVYITTFLTCIAVLALVFGVSQSMNLNRSMDSVTVGFLYESDESAPYSYNFARSQTALKEDLKDSVTILTKHNVPDDAIEDMVREFAVKGCSIIFTNCHSEVFAQLAPLFPDVQICQISDMKEVPADYPDNYHTFNGEIYQARYVSGIAAGLKLRELIEDGVITPDQALVGYVGSYPIPTVISGYTAFLIGVRSVCPQAVMRVHYTGAWADYREEKRSAHELIDEGCIVISQHSDTAGCAVACEEALTDHPVIFVGSNRGMLDIAPATALLSIRINWAPYVTGAVRAVMNYKKIENSVKGHVHGNDISFGFTEGALEILDVNTNLTAQGTGEAADAAVELMKKHPETAFQGDYTGVNPEDPSDTSDLKDGWLENESSSCPSFHYILKDIIRPDTFS